MVDAIVKLAGSLFIGGLGFVFIVGSLFMGAILIHVLWDHYKDKC